MTPMKSFVSNFIITAKMKEKCQQNSMKVLYQNIKKITSENW